MSGSHGTGFGMELWGALVLILLVLGVAALVKQLMSDAGRPWP